MVGVMTENMSTPDPQNDPKALSNWRFRQNLSKTAIEDGRPHKKCQKPFFLLTLQLRKPSLAFSDFRREVVEQGKLIIRLLVERPRKGDKWVFLGGG